MSGHFTCSENFAYSAYFGRNSDKLATFWTGKPSFSGPSNNGLSCSEVKPSILKSAYSTTLSLSTMKIDAKFKGKLTFALKNAMRNLANLHRLK